ncbi:oligosaccharide flippase family protein [Candidatus Woesebacteria bacterium]|nr:oligosaccharide flippase family protein [Candidatus Woesebacteria bacterium]
MQWTRFAWVRKFVPVQKSVRKAIVRFWPHAAVGSVAITLINNMDLLFVQGTLNSLETGLYAGASRLASFVVLATYAVSSVLNNRVSRYRSKKDLRAYLWKSLSLAGLAFLGFLVFVPLSRTLIIWTIGPEYLGGLLPFIILVANALLGFALVPYTSYFFAVDAPSYHSVGGVLQVSLIVLGNILFLPAYGLLAAATIRFVTTLVFGVYTLGMILLTWRKAGV